MTAPRSERDLVLLLAGSLQSLVGDLLPRFQWQTGYRCEAYAGGSREWARRIRQESVSADVLLSADASVNETELMRPGEERAEWYLVFATNELVLCSSPTSPVASEMRAIARDELGWLRLLQAGYRLGRPDPDADPKGYRTLFALQLAEQAFGPAGLLASVTGSPRNPEQPSDPVQLGPMLARGELDLSLMYRSQAEEADLPFVELPEQVNLGSPTRADSYAAASYECSDGTRYCGTPIAYSATPLSHAPHPLAAAAFIAFLASDEAVAAVERHHFHTTRLLVRPR